MTDLLGFFGSGFPTLYGDTIHYLSGGEQINSPGKTLPPIEMGDFLGLEISAINNSGDYDIQIDWFSENPDIDPRLCSFTDLYAVRAGQLFQTTVITKGLWMRVTIYSGAASYVWDNFFWATPTNNVSQPNRTSIIPPLITRTPALQAPTSTVAYNPNTFYAGYAWLHFVTTATLWTVTVTMASLTGGNIQTPIFQTNQAEHPNKRIEQEILLPPQRVTVSLTNGDAGNQTMEMTLLQHLFDT